MVMKEDVDVDEDEKSSSGRLFVNRLYEVESALQKCIRRGMVFDAVCFALELEDINPTLLWYRLRIIASEDVGCANPLMPVLIKTLYGEYMESKKGIDSFHEAYPLFVVNAVVNLCRSPHSRITDELYHKIHDNNIRLPIPDFALDGIHTRRCTQEGHETWDYVENEPEDLKELRKRIKEWKK